MHAGGIDILQMYIKFVLVLGPTFTKCDVQLMMNMYFDYVYVYVHAL